METFILPKKLRGKLKNIWGIPIFGKKNEIEKKFFDLFKKKRVKKIITVGDFCSKNLPSNVKIFDGKIKRIKIKKILKFNLKCKNPAGTIQSEVWPKIKKAIKENKNLFVEGEEDLLVIPAVLLAPKNSLVIYGYPKKGICVIEVNERAKKKIKNLLTLFSKYEQ